MYATIMTCWCRQFVFDRGSPSERGANRRQGGWRLRWLFWKKIRSSAECSKLPSIEKGTTRLPVQGDCVMVQLSPLIGFRLTLVFCYLCTYFLSTTSNRWIQNRLIVPLRISSQSRLNLNFPTASRPISTRINRHVIL